MTREERAREHLHAKWITAGKVWEDDAIRAMLAFADAEAAAMRERAAGVADAHADHAGRLMSAGIDAVTDERVVFQITSEKIATAIRALPTTEVGNG